MNNILKNKEGFTTVEALLIVLILIVIGAVGYMVYHNDHKTNIASSTTSAGSSQQSKLAPLADPDTSGIISGVEKALSANYTLSQGTFSNGGVSNPPNANTLTVNSMSGGPVYSVSGYNFDLSPPQGTTLNIRAYQSTSSNVPPDISNILNIIASEFSTLKLVSIPGSTATSLGANYQNRTAYCNFNDSSNSQDVPYPFSIACADKTTYSEEAAVMSPLVKAYYKSNPQPPAGAKDYFADLVIKNSETPGYKFATLGVDEAEGYYYQKDGTWYFYAAGQDGFYCNFTTNSQASLNNNDARLAFLGQSCQNSDGTAGTVQ
jgi:hypothetical protein